MSGPVVPGSLRLRAAEDRDAQGLFGLLALCFADYPGCYVDPHDDLKDLLRPAAAYGPDGRFWVVDDEAGAVAACVAVDFPRDGVAELHRLYVRPDRQGRGIATVLTRTAETEAARRGASIVELWSDGRFVRAHALYRKLGYGHAGRMRELGDISRSVELFFSRTLPGST